MGYWNSRLVLYHTLYFLYFIGITAKSHPLIYFQVSLFCITVIILSKSYSSSESVYSDISYCVNSHDLQSPSVPLSQLPSSLKLLQGPSSINLTTSLQYDGSIQIKNPDSRSENILAHVND